MKYKEDHHSWRITCNLSSWEKNAWKNSGVSGFEPGPLWSWYSTLTNYAVAKALPPKLIKSLRSCHFLITFFVIILFFWLSFYLFLILFFRPCWKNKWVSPACSKRFGQKRTKNVHSRWNVLSYKGSVLSRGKKTQAAIIASRHRFSSTNALITCNTLSDDQDIIELPAFYNNVIFSNTLYRHWEKLLPENINAINTILDDSSGCCRYNMLELLKL